MSEVSKKGLDELLYQNSVHGVSNLTVESCLFIGYAIVIKSGIHFSINPYAYN